jgi:hypothetical protein
LKQEFALSRYLRETVEGLGRHLIRFLTVAGDRVVVDDDKLALGH